MERIAFCLRLRPGTEDAYDEAHRHVWPEMLDLLKRAGLSDYSIFRRGALLFFYIHADNFERCWQTIEDDPVNERWQRAMDSPLPASE